MSFECLKDKAILITGGTGSFGRSFVRHLLGSKAKKIVVFSRDELKQSEMQSEMKDERLRFFIGDIRDLSRLQRAFRDVDVVVHAAALKQVPAMEYNPFEAVQTNIIGSQNVIEAAIDQGVRKVLLISTDKAAEPINLYGATKLCAEKLFISGNSYAPGKTILSAVRYGNVIGSRGSVIDVLKRSRDVKRVYITDPAMTRFWITLNQSFKLVDFALENMTGGEIFIPKLSSMKLSDLFDVLAPGAEREIIGPRAGEKIHEVLLTSEESYRALEMEDMYVVLPLFPYEADIHSKYHESGRKPESGFRFASHTNKNWLTKEDFKKILNDEL
ncbi:MAG: UDP-N-acetylglucosamine 4,6-dehydratase (inverting) [Candidatus Niyogibacteria bacterium]|nr:MAG: UDP-N-acetylglucosamine 4,6-dehydratase (inverting) [Candidatus Niyogibacteria bacterium]